ncbi:Peptidyl-prolyl cis-trans isomerase H [Phytophthora pseudosyringae]|uniref:peptidylprolyl isomerase n=1 Tax=Phytophthora pseudosyringae TaxID=221518 RepID=A0A8T1VHS9_9STRA|nr:Peptidyl-prolyl cis-trans isomerase H [Phytophthora pseudosyringae]
MDAALSEALRRGNPVVFLDLSIGGAPAGRLRLELFKKDCPRTVENFRCISDAASGVGLTRWCSRAFWSCAVARKSELPVGYKGSTFHRVIKDFMVQGGDFLKGDGTGRISIYGDKFEDENFAHKHTEPGLLSMANSGPATNGCQFFLTCAPCDWLDGKHVVFGKVLDPPSLLLLRKMESVPVGPSSKPKLAITVTECGEL